MRAIQYVVAYTMAWVLVGCASTREPPQVTLPRSAQHDLTSKTNGESYRVMVALPPKHDREKVYPVLYVMEGNVYFAAAADAMARQATYRNAAPAIVVGVGYPSDDYDVGLVRRWYDLTPTADPKEKRRTGGGDEYLKFIEEVVKPFIAARYRVDPARQALWGHSLGGMLVLRAMYRNPTSYSVFLASSPATWWDESVVLKDEPTFVRGLATMTAPARLLITYGSRDSDRIMKDAADLNDRLAKGSRERLVLERYVLDGESHISVAHMALIRSLRFAFPPPPR